MAAGRGWVARALVMELSACVCCSWEGGRKEESGDEEGAKWWEGAALEFGGRVRLGWPLEGS